MTDLLDNQEDYVVTDHAACIVCDDFGCEHCPGASSHLNKPRKFVPRELPYQKYAEVVKARREQLADESQDYCDGPADAARRQNLTVTVTFRFHNKTHLREFIRAIRQHPNVESLD